jgi:hypothetical protein
MTSLAVTEQKQNEISVAILEAVKERRTAIFEVDGRAFLSVVEKEQSHKKRSKS